LRHKKTVYRGIGYQYTIQSSLQLHSAPLRRHYQRHTMSDPFSPYLDRFEKPEGPGDARPTALEVVQDNDLIGKLSDKVILITGTTAGIGIETARALHETGAKLFLGVRNMKRGAEVVADILDKSQSKGEIELVEMDLTSLASVRDAAEQVKQKTDRLNILINNAGIMAVPTRELSKDGYELQFATNHLSHFLLFQLLKPLLIESATPDFCSRVVNVSSLGHRTAPPDFSDLMFAGERKYNPWQAYGQSKTANIWMTNYISRHYGPHHLHGNALHPGGIATNLQRYMDPAVMARFSEDPQTRAYLKSPEQGAATTVWAAIGKAFEGVGGKYLEDCMVSPPAPPAENRTPRDRGYETWAFNEENEDRLWRVSNELVGFKEE
jgi:NAD(P)-dependent dehydrogenase (short-subunit alcohol dehydrogenase family)